MTVKQLLIVVAMILVGIGAAMFATWIDPNHPGAWVTFGAVAWLGSQL